MLSKKDLLGIREHLEKAQNPVFYFDNDADGFFAFLLLRRFIGRGYGVAIRSYPGLNEDYLRKAQQLNADYIFILDKPVLSDEFIRGADAMQLPIVWIDHHDMNIKEVMKGYKDIKNFYLFNPTAKRGKAKSSEPTSYICYKATGRKEDLWIAMMGCIADHYLPDFASDFAKRYPDFWKKGINQPFEAYFGTEIGRIALSINFGLKDSTSNVVNMQNFMISCKSPNDVFLEVEMNKSFREKSSEIMKKYEWLLKEAVESESGKLISLVYGGDLSISADLSNRLSYLYPDKRIIVAYNKGAITNISMRGDNVRKILEGILKKVKDATGGGHKNAVGARIKTEDLDMFIEMVEKGI